jgi:predicted TIM-barrel fold metal-dependent hydrolase
MADESARRDRPVAVVSCDSHVGPLLEEQLRPYCPAAHLERFDEFVEAHRAVVAAAAPGELVPEYPEMHVAGHHDPVARLADMDREGIAAEVIYHFSMNGEPLPFVTNPAGGLAAVPADGLELGAVGYRIYNRWLADFVAIDPTRLLGLAYIPSWDIEASVREVEWAAGAGLAGINFPPPGRPGHLEYNDAAWEPFWDVCEQTGMSLHTHSGNAGPFDYMSGTGGLDLLIYECGGWMARRAVWWLIHGRVFERHPKLRLVITEQYEGWWLNTLAELDAVYARFGTNSSAPRLLRQPSEYMSEHVYLGSSFLSKHMANEAWHAEYAGNVMWGRDYPHAEGTFHVVADGEEAISRLSLRHSLAGLPEREARRIAGENAMDVLGLDRGRLEAIAERIGGPTAAELTTEPPSLPAVRPVSNAFRGQAGPRREVLA